MNNLPVLLEELIKKQYNQSDFESIIEGFTKTRKTTFRINTIKTTKEKVLQELDSTNILYTPSLLYIDAYYIEGSEENLMKLKCYQDGLIYLQSFSSMIPPLLFNYQSKDAILDMAAAPGGKTSLMAVLANNSISITACEKDKIRAERLKYNLNKQGVLHCVVINKDASMLDDFFSFDKVLLDAPCTGSGTISLNNNNRFEQVFLDRMIKAQKNLLTKALKLLKINHEMIYSTCSILQQENEDILKPFIEKGIIQIIPIDEKYVTNIPQLPSSIPGTLLVKPNELYEGFFVAKLKRIK